MSSRLKVSDEEILEVVRNNRGASRVEQASLLGISESTLRLRLRNLRLAGSMNDDRSVPDQSPGVGREITKVSKMFDSNDEIVHTTITEKPTSDPESLVTPYGERVRLSTLTDATGKIISQWDIRRPRPNDEAEQAALEEFKSHIPALPPSELISSEFNESLASHFTLSDVHLGLVAQEAMAGEKWDLEYGERMVLRCMEAMISRAPPAPVAIINILGDWFHFDSLLPLTPTSHNVLTQTTTYKAMIRVGIRLMHRLIDLCLMTHSRVIVIIAEGNHDLVSSEWLRQMMSFEYREEGRVEFIGVDDERPFYAFAFGKTFLGYHHGHIRGLKEPEKLALMFFDTFPELAGSCEYRFIHTGHLHHEIKKPVNGWMMIQHPTLSAKDHHHVRHNYRGVRGTKVESYHSNYGYAGEIMITPAMIEK